MEEEPTALPFGHRGRHENQCGLFLKAPVRGGLRREGLVLPIRLPDMVEKHVELEIDGPIARVWLNRPEKLNGITFDLLQGLMDAAAEIEKDRDVRVVLLEGRGASFCAGLDFGTVMKDPKRMKTWFIPNPFRGTNRFQEPLWVWRRLSVPVIAITRGHVFGGGIQLALAADFRFTTPDCQWSIMEAKWGLVPDMSGTVPLIEQLPGDLVKRLVFTGETFDGTKAAEYGLASGVSDDPEAQAMELVEQLLERSPDSVAASKLLMNRVRHLSVRRSFALERRLQFKMLRSPNTAIAREAGAKKLKAVFKPRTFRG